MTFFDLPGTVGVLPVDGDVVSVPFDDGQSVGSANTPPNAPTPTPTPTPK